MRLTLGVLADAANVTAEQKINLLGEFNLIRTPEFPFALASFALVFRLEADGAEAAEHSVAIRLVDDDGDLVRAIVDGAFRLGNADVPGVPRRVQGVVPITVAQFTRPGTYTFEILVDGQRPEMICAPIEVHVLHVPSA